jgi:cellulose synthase/poly-beta-1,6-N-acetylglucosamine synthase-like glycosyltransferase
VEFLLSITFTIAAAFAGVLVAIFFIEVLAAVITSQIQHAPCANKNYKPSQRIVVLVPAHNENTSLVPTLRDIKQQLRPGDSVLVVADNCTDDTAAVATAQGAEVIERHDPTRRGKGYALDFGVRHLSSKPPDIVIVVDADCRLADKAIDDLATTCAIKHRPAQALYLMTPPTESTINYQVAEFAWRVRNGLRPLGLLALKLPCQLMGTGMAFPWDVLCHANLDTNLIVEDLNLGLELASKGHAPIFCPSARVTSQFAPSVRASRTQRERWEAGHIGMIYATFPRLFCKAVATRNWNLLALTLDLAVPPLSLLAFFVLGMFVVASCYAFSGFSSPSLTVSTASLIAFLLAGLLAWLKCGRDLVPIRAVLAILFYLSGKLNIYRAILSRKIDAQWIRTERENSDHPIP